MSKLILYHGTTADFSKVDLRYARGNKDFGLGFYLTTDFNQAHEWARRLKLSKLRKGYNAKGFIYSFKLDTQMFKDLNIHTFKGASRAWLEYIISNRRGYTSDKVDYDIVIGKVADAYAQQLIDEYVLYKDYSEKAKDRLTANLKVDRLMDQYCFKTARAVAILNSTGIYRKEI